MDPHDRKRKPFDYNLKPTRASQERNTIENEIHALDHTVSRPVSGKRHKTHPDTLHATETSYDADVVHDEPIEDIDSNPSLSAVDIHSSGSESHTDVHSAYSRDICKNLGFDVIIHAHFPSHDSRLHSIAAKDCFDEIWGLTWHPRPILKGTDSQSHKSIVSPDKQHLALVVEYRGNTRWTQQKELKSPQAPAIEPDSAQYPILERDMEIEVEIYHPGCKKGNNLILPRQQCTFTTTNPLYRIDLAHLDEEIFTNDGMFEFEIRLQSRVPPRDAITQEYVKAAIPLGQQKDITNQPSIVGSKSTITRVIPSCNARNVISKEQSPASSCPNLLPHSNMDLHKSFATPGYQVPHEAKNDIGMVGLKNQGATCYMNSLLQTLYHLRAFRRVVYDIPTEKEDTKDSVTLALQRVFYRLQTKSKAVSTKELTRSFGWSQIDAFMQHDVQELYRILCDRLEEKMKCTNVKGMIRRLFAGTVRSYIRCVDVKYESYRDESFYDLQLDVKGCSDVYASFRKYIAIEMLEGENQYEADGYGKQNAQKATCFLNFPPILNLQLKRFEYDPMRDGMVKIHDHFAFPTQLVLDEFLHDPDQKQEQNEYMYHLHSVLVHSGDVHGGHYYVFVRPGRMTSECTRWYKFDDEQIISVEEEEAVNGNFGLNPPSASQYCDFNMSRPPSPLESATIDSRNTVGNPEARKTHLTSSLLPPHVGRIDIADSNAYQDNTTIRAGDLLAHQPAGIIHPLAVPSARNFSSAYMLVYIRNGLNDIKGIQQADSETHVCNSEEALTHCNDVAIPRCLEDRFHEEEKVAARRKKLQQTEHLYMVFRISSDYSIQKLRKYTKILDFASFGSSSCLRLRIKRTESIRQLYYRIHKYTEVPVNQLRLWKIITRENRTIRPDSPVSSEYLDNRVDTLIDEDAASKSPVRLFLQILSSQSRTLYPIYNHCKPLVERMEAQEDVEGTRDDLERDVEELRTSTDDLKLLKSMTIAPVRQNHVLLFIKYYDIKITDINNRLQYIGNVLVNAAMTGSDLARHLQEALGLPYDEELILYEEIQPISVVEVNLLASLHTSELQHGDIICFQKESDLDDLKEAPFGKIVKDTNSARWQEGHSSFQADLCNLDDAPIEPYPDAPSYFNYLLNRIDVAFYNLHYPDKEAFVLSMLLSNVYDEITAAVADHLQLGSKRSHLRLYQHSAIYSAPKSAPLLHSQYHQDHKTTLDDFLTEYSERTNVLYYEILDIPIIELEAKRRLIVYFSTYDDCFLSPSGNWGVRSYEFFVEPTATVRDLLDLVGKKFFPEKIVTLGSNGRSEMRVPLHLCEVSHGGSFMHRSLTDESLPLQKYWSSSNSEGVYDTEGTQKTATCSLFVERVLDSSGIESLGFANSACKILRVVHFSYPSPSQKWIHPHSVPLSMFYRSHEPLRDVLERIRIRIGVAKDLFSNWNVAYIINHKAHLFLETYSASEMKGLIMRKVYELYDGDLERLTIGLEHNDSLVAASGKYNRRQEQGIRIR